MHCHYTAYDDTPDSTHSLVIGLVPEGSRVLEFGCATGYMSEVLKSERGCVVTGIEISPEAAELAAEHCHRMIVGDAETLDYDELLGDERFDAIVFADVLEHLRDPGALLERIRPFLVEGGVVVASVPNIAHGSVRLALLGGEFRYQDSGLLDETHLRFYTRATIQELFEENGYAITRWLRRRIDPESTEIPEPAHLPADAREWASNADAEASTYQFVVRAVPADTGVQLLETRRELERVLAELDELERSSKAAAEEGVSLAAELVGAREELKGLRRAHEVLSRRLMAERAAFADGMAHLQASLYASRSWRYTAPLRRMIALAGRFRR